MAASIFFVDVCKCGRLKKSEDNECVRCNITALKKIYNMATKAEFWSKLLIPATAFTFIAYTTNNSYLNVRERMILNNAQLRLMEDK